jgi:hypothetical protein
MQLQPGCFINLNDLRKKDKVVEADKGVPDSLSPIEGEFFSFCNHVFLFTFLTQCAMPPKLLHERLQNQLCYRQLDSQPLR